jgi:DMSO/TMAO reductase YedYZ molybdopterin-dependent catalytic subunit
MKEKTSGLITRRGALIAGAAAVGGVFLARRFPKILPPTCGNALRAGDSFTYGMQRALLSDRALAKEYRPEDLTSFPATGTTDPVAGGGPFAEKELSEAYRRLRDGAFADWRLPVGGSVAKPQAFTLAELKQFPSRTQITRHQCEEGWSAIGQWTGVPLSAVLDAAGVLPSARFVLFHAYDGFAESIDMVDALHPQTILAYGMSGRDLPIPHGAPVRLRVERQMGYKSLKFLRSVTVADRFEDGGANGDIQNGWAWYTGI